MKTIVCSLLFSGIVLGVPAVRSEEPLRGVAGVEVRVKENASKRFVTDARGSFALQGLAPGSYTLLFKAQKAKDTKLTSPTTVAVAQSYSIKIDGAKRPVNRNGASDQLVAGVAVPVEVGAGGQIHGQVATAQAQKMVWIAPALGSHIPGHWVPADSPEAKGHSARSTFWMKGRDVQDMIDRHDPMRQGG